MLTTLRIRNLALVADLTLDLQPGFNAITGETGAGKSILIGALNLLLGQRADRTLLRSGCDTCTVEAVLEEPKLGAPLEAFLIENGLEPMADGQLLLKRTFTATGTNRQFINGSPASLQTLATLGERLVDIHGPHDHQSLFHPARQLELLDAHAGLGQQREAFAALFAQRAALIAQKEALVIDEQTYSRQLDLLRHQVHEIAAARLQPEDEEQLESEHTRARNATRLVELIQGATAILGDDDDALLVRLGQVGRNIQELVRLDPSASSVADQHTSALEALRALQSALAHYGDRIELDPARFQQLEERLNLVNSLRRKYGATIAAVMDFGDSARAQLEQLEGRDAELTRINEEQAKLDGELKTQGAAFTAARRRAIPRLEKAVAAQLKDLGFLQSELRVELRTTDTLQSSGFDTVEFQFAPNPGEPARPLRAIASSGELARVMLALKTVLAAQDDIPVLVFDEVDANIGGETARAVGDKMRQIGRRRQVLCITHLAPVAASGDAHFVVNKVSREGRTLSEITPVTGAHRVAELARMLGGGPAAQQHAKALLTS